MAHTQDLERKIIYIQPLGDAVTPEEEAAVSQMLVNFYGVDVRTLPPLDLPPEAYIPARDRYRAEMILDQLEDIMPDDAYRVIGLTGKDLGAKKGKIADWGVAGLASFNTGVCVVSSVRCCRSAANPEQRLERLGKVAVHEIGHTLGLQHCSVDGCFMEDAKGSVLTVDREYELCAQCRELLTQGGSLASDDSPSPEPALSP